MNSLQNFFYPKTICVAGASTKEKSIGYELLKTIKSYGFTGNVLPVNPKADEILGYKCFHSIEEITETIDLAIIVVPKQFAESTVDSLLAKKVKSIILITAGFKEIGPEGEVIEKRIIEKIKSFGARMVGPNCMGVISTLENVKLNATFVAEKPEMGSTGFFSQSGALGAAVLNSLRETDIKFAHFISAGNKADINENDILNYWEEDVNISTQTYYLESFVDGQGFLKPFIENRIAKPVIILKAGKTDSGMKAASSHTGALSGKDKIADALLKQFGIIRVDNLNELFNTAKGFENFRLPKGNRIAVVTNAGGPAILAVDKLETEGLKLADLSDSTKKLLREIVHPEGSVENPVDLLPGGNAETYKRVNEIIADDENVDAIISIFVEPVMVAPFEVVENVYSINTYKPIFQVVMPLPEFWQKYRHESKEKLPLFRNPEDPAEIISNMLFHINTSKKLKTYKDEINSLLKIESRQNNYKEGYISQGQIIELANQYKIPIVQSFTLKRSEFGQIQRDFYPLVLKAINTKVIHKSDMNAVKLDIKNDVALNIAAEEMEKQFAKHDFEVEEYLVQKFISAKHELLIGGFRDASFGPVIMFGSGGKYVEVFDDVAIKSCYMCEQDIEEMINSTKIGKILGGVRGESAVNFEELKSIIKHCSKMMIENENISEFDINPLVISKENELFAVDLRVKCS